MVNWRTIRRKPPFTQEEETYDTCPNCGKKSLRFKREFKDENWEYTRSCKNCYLVKDV